jgi:hypothetical protein
MLTAYSLLWLATPSAPGTREIRKVDYYGPTYATPRRYERILQALSWAQPVEWIPLVHLGGDASFHVEVEVPEGVAIRSAQPKFFWLVPDSQVRADEPDPAPLTPESIQSTVEKSGVRPQQHVAIEGRFAHVYISGRRPLGGDLLLRVGASRGGLPTAALIAAFVLAILYAPTTIRSQGRISRESDGW